MLLQNHEVIQHKLVRMLNMKNEAKRTENDALHVENVCLQLLIQLQETENQDLHISHDLSLLW